MTQYQQEERNRIKRQRSENAIRMAKEGRWAEAVSANQELLVIFPDDTETLNRLGKSFLELKRFSEARTAYEESLRHDPNNLIAQKNLQRLQQVEAASLDVLKVAPKSESTTDNAPGTDRDGPSDGGSGQVQPTTTVPSGTGAVAPSLFIEETGKTGRTKLSRLAASTVLTKLTAGDQVQLEVGPQGTTLSIKTHEGEYIGEVEPKLATRLIRFLQAGNRYSAFLTSVRSGDVEIIIRETYQHPSQRGKLSFPPSQATAYRAYTKDLVTSRFDEEGDDDDGDDETVGDDDDDDGEEDTEPELEFEDEAENLSGR